MASHIFFRVEGFFYTNQQKKQELSNAYEIGCRVGARGLRLKPYGKYMGQNKNVITRQFFSILVYYKARHSKPPTT